MSHICLSDVERTAHRVFLLLLSLHCRNRIRVFECRPVLEYNHGNSVLLAFFFHTLNSSPAAERLSLTVAMRLIICAVMFEGTISGFQSPSIAQSCPQGVMRRRSR